MLWRCIYDGPTKTRYLYSKDKGFIVRFARATRVRGWKADVAKVSLKTAKHDQSFDFWGDPLKITKPGPLMGKTRYRQVKRWLAARKERAA
jgi:hypothetical protein